MKNTTKKQGQHYLLSAKARTLSLMQIMRLSDDEAFNMFKDARWENGETRCPRCNHNEHYWIGTRKQWRCKSCGHSFSVTSGTIFANHKMPLSALQLSRDLDCQYKTAFVLAHKLRESLLDDEIPELDGEVEMDAAYVNGHVRPANRIHQRIDRRLKRNQDPMKRAVYVARERCDSGYGASKTVTTVAGSENEMSVLRFAKKHVEAGTIINADEHRAYDVLNAFYPTERVNHSKEYVGINGESTNQAESFFSRFRRMQIGQMHSFGNLYLNRYANEAAYREDTRRRSNGDIFTDIVSRCAKSEVSRHFCGYWQGNKKPMETLI